MTQLETLKAELALKLQASVAETREKVEVARVTAKIAMLDNPAMQTARINSAITKATTTKLAELNAICEEIVVGMPLLNKKTKENRKWNPSRQYGLGNQIAAVTGLLSGIQYSAQEHKVQMLALTGLDEDTIEQTLDAFGSTPYYSKNHGVVVDGTGYDLSALLGNLALIEEILDVKLDISKVTDTVMTNRAKVERIKAELALAEAAKTDIADKGTLLID